MVTPLSNTSFTVNWIISDPNYNYTVTWTNLNTGVMDSYTVAENTNSYNVTGLSDNDNYNVTITAVGVCGMITSDPVTVYGECVSSYIIMSAHTFMVSVHTYTHVAIIDINFLYHAVKDIKYSTVYVPTLCSMYVRKHVSIKVETGSASLTWIMH